MSKKNIAKETFKQLDGAKRKAHHRHDRRFIHIFINLKSHITQNKPYQYMDKKDIETLKKAVNGRLLFESGVKTHFINKYDYYCDQPVNYRPTHGQEHYKKQYGIEGLPF